MKILAIETSCDETGASIVKDGHEIITNVLATSLATHVKTGGVIPENAAREQLHYMIPVLDEATNGQDYDAIAVTYGPGLVGSLLVGIETAKALSYAKRLPLIPVNHLYGHIYSSWVSGLKPKLPAIVLIASGAHSDLVILNENHQIKYLGGTRDDAAGEAFDKTARLLGLPYPGGPAISESAKSGQPGKIPLPRPMIHDDSFDFSFSGFKTAVRTLIDKNILSVPDTAAEIEDAITDVLVNKTVRAAQAHNISSIILGGGVAANTKLREKFTSFWKKDLFIPQIKLSTDNAAMIAAAAFFHNEPIEPFDLQVNPSLSFLVDTVNLKS